MDPSLKLSSSCRILTICSSLDRAVSFVQLGTCILICSCIDRDTDSIGGRFIQRDLIPWTISNKYYSAKVHFFARTVKGLAPFHFKDVPAVIFVWRKGSAYKHHIQRICRDRDLNGSEPEVSLAVRIDSKEDNTIGAEDEEENEEEEEEFDDSAEIDEFLSSKGFEFIDVPASFDGQEDEKKEILADVIPSLPRVLDALSTIMWPSMEASLRKQKRPAQARTEIADDNGGLLDWAQSSFHQNDDIDFEDSVVVQTPASRMATAGAQWLEEDPRNKDDADDDPWEPSSSRTGEMSMSPTSEEGGLSVKEDGFDDDFTVFVSAPAEDSVSSGAPPAALHSDSTGSRLDFSEAGFPSFASFGDGSFTAPSFVEGSADADVDTSFDSLAPPTRYSSVMYHSLGSASDLGDGYEEEAPPASLGDDKQDRDAAEVDSDDGLPTESEIRASAQRIFGPLPSSITLPSSSSSSNAKSQEVDEDEKDDFGEDDMDFDLSHMVSAIQGMKTEISAMESEDDRRKAAARVALGLVYGLDRHR
ncbi:hypothetical protein BT96DRAFT_959231 [Gymnopus androsaceus JB14]|uniref:Uncharacterized protein n=1 Tax=Gymnopus androsaceus JB14 TaxID=1447944 RepID=A0A6A4H3R7_9AGAR|nr:hypothetical protein BT96DRAFT_959231 [Gymnopus androsaceus JB14]